MNKSYKGLWMWTLMFLAGFYPIIVLAKEEAIRTKFTLLYTAAMVALLAYIIHRTDSIYWYSGISFEEAIQAGEERRMEYAAKHLQKFARFAVFYTIFTAVSIYCNISIWLDITVFTIGITAVAISTITIKL